MEYERTEDGQIQAAFAKRVGQLLLQYERLCGNLEPEDQFESTLAIALLQSMLTMCHELVTRVRKPKDAPRGLASLVEMASKKLETEPPLLGLTSDCVLERWPSEQGTTYRDLIECIRHALSHPLPQGVGNLARTGFTTELSDTGKVRSYLFTRSPWVNSTGSAVRPDFQDREKTQRWLNTNRVSDITFKDLPNGKITTMLGGHPFVPIFRIRLDVAQLRLLVLGLSDYLSEALDQEAPLQSPCMQT